MLVVLFFLCIGSFSAGSLYFIVVDSFAYVGLVL